MEQTYKLYYFPANGKAAVTRAILTYVGAKWEDKRIYGEEWDTLKQSGNLDYDQIPGLEVNGKWLVQTTAIEVYLAKKFNLLGDTDEDLYEIINLIGTRDDIAKSLTPVLLPTEEQKAKIEEIVADLKDNVLPKWLQAWEKKYVAKHGKYFLGDKFTLADIYMTAFCEVLFHLKKGKGLGFDALLTKHAPKLAAHMENIKNNELANYFKNVFSYDLDM
jgi:glutathione S-transferase